MQTYGEQVGLPPENKNRQHIGRNPVVGIRHRMPPFIVPSVRNLVTG
jgi:hypothetical protein